MRFAFFVIALLLLAVGVAPCHAEKRVALVIGNDHYANLSAREQLQKAVSDARSVGNALRQIGFEVITGENPGRQALIDKLDDATRRSAGATVFFFFSGHGVAVDGANYILPADVPDVADGQATRLKGAAIAEEYITAELMGGGAQVAVVVLDACRSNPFARSGTKGVGSEKGLQPREPPSGIFALYTAGRGEAALDRLYDGDRNPNSVFTRALLPVLTKPGLDLPGLAVEVRGEVTRLARTVQHEQRPAYYDGTIGGRIYLAGLPPAGAGGAPGSGPGSSAQPLPAGPAADEVAWSIVKDTRDPAQLRRFIAQFPVSPRSREAAQRLAALEQNTSRTPPSVAAPIAAPPASAPPASSAPVIAAPPKPAPAIGSVAAKPVAPSAPGPGLRCLLPDNTVVSAITHAECRGKDGLILN